MIFLVRRLFTLELRRDALEVRVPARELGALVLAALAPPCLGVVVPAGGGLVTRGRSQMPPRSLAS